MSEVKPRRTSFGKCSTVLAGACRCFSTVRRLYILPEPGYMMNMLTSRQLEMTADIAKSLGLVILPASVADAVLDGTRIAFDIAGMSIGVLLLISAVYLTGKVDGGRI